MSPIVLPLPGPWRGPTAGKAASTKGVATVVDRAWLE